MIGAGALIMKDTKDNEVYVAARGRSPTRRTSDEIGF